jgi:phosphatidylserine/phosphatidylglycerophosphate/cardiolipin synthase-like enzyme
VSSHRQIHSSVRSAELRDLLQSLFVAELIAPSRCVWLVSPWISDIPVIDNEASSFGQLAPEWPRGHVRLSQVLARMLGAGTTVHVATRDEDRNRSFLSTVCALAESGRLRTHTSNELHEKGFLGDDYYLSGSMNFTISGIQINEEFVHLITDTADIARNRVILTQRWGGECK